MRRRPRAIDALPRGCTRTCRTGFPISRASSSSRTSSYPANKSLSESRALITEATFGKCQSAAQACGANPIPDASKTPGANSPAVTSQTSGTNRNAATSPAAAISATDASAEARV